MGLSKSPMPVLSSVVLQTIAALPYHSDHCAGVHEHGKGRGEVWHPPASQGAGYSAHRHADAASGADAISAQPRLLHLRLRAPEMLRLTSREQPCFSAAFSFLATLPG